MSICSLKWGLGACLSHLFDGLMSFTQIFSNANAKCSETVLLACWINLNARGDLFVVQLYKLTQEDPNKYSDANVKQLGPQLSTVNVIVKKLQCFISYLSFYLAVMSETQFSVYKNEKIHRPIKATVEEGQTMFRWDKITARFQF